MQYTDFNVITFRNFKNIKWSAKVVLEFGFKSIPVHYVEALMEAPCQLVLQIYVISRGQSPGKLQNKLIQM